MFISSSYHIALIAPTVCLKFYATSDEIFQQLSKLFAVQLAKNVVLWFDFLVRNANGEVQLGLKQAEQNIISKC